MGHSGAGKSTIFNLLPRFYNLNKGQIFIDDQDISEVSKIVLEMTSECSSAL